MRYALVNGQKQEAQRGLAGECQGCRLPVLAKCGTVRVKHWAHRGKCAGDVWWEPETEWHRSWKGQFPDEWQEIIHTSDTGEKHIADVKTDHDFVLEFQHSQIATEERNARNSFYKKLVWVVDATRRKRDKPKFLELLSKGVRGTGKPSLLRLAGYLDECALLRDWAGSPTPVFFDFGEVILWYMLPNSSINLAYVIEFPREYFVNLHRNGNLMRRDLEFWFGGPKEVSPRQVPEQTRRLRPAPSFQLRPRRHFRF